LRRRAPLGYPAMPGRRNGSPGETVASKKNRLAAGPGRKGPTVEIFADGACFGNPGPGGYAAILKSGEKEKEIAGYVPHTTNNRMELTAVIEALRRLKRPCVVKVITDSNYVIKGMTEWIAGWIKRNWLNARKEPVLNRDLWEQLLRLTRPHSIEWEWVKGHQGHPQNERCDTLAKHAIEEGLARQGRRHS
jgi:ribonuclease HI